MRLALRWKRSCRCEKRHKGCCHVGPWPDEAVRMVLKRWVPEYEPARH